jgi:hypothetical protein
MKNPRRKATEKLAKSKDNTLELKIQEASLAISDYGRHMLFSKEYRNFIIRSKCGFVFSSIFLTTTNANKL